MLRAIQEKLVPSWLAKSYDALAGKVEDVT